MHVKWWMDVALFLSVKEPTGVVFVVLASESDGLAA